MRQTTATGRRSSYDRSDESLERQQRQRSRQWYNTQTNTRSRMQNGHTSGEQTSGERLATALGWFSVALGLSQVVAPARVAQMIGVDDTDAACNTMRALGVRELTAGVGILSQEHPTGWVRSRVAGDVMDLALLGFAMRSNSNGRNKNDHNKTIAATAAVLGVTALDMLCSRQLARSSESREAGGMAHGVHVQRSVTINRSPEEVAEFWNAKENLPKFLREVVEPGAVQFATAPTGQGTEISVDFHYSPPGGKMGAAFAKLFHQEPGQQVYEELRHIKQLLETGEILLSDATVRPGMHPAQPDKHASKHASKHSNGRSTNRVQRQLQEQFSGRDAQ
jgi:hypothetical protein